MNKAWPKVSLGEVLKLVSRGESVEGTKEYPLLGVRLEGNGPFLRETLMGSASSATRLYRVEKDDFIYSRLFACRGAFGVVSEELSGCYVSNEFPTFVPVPGKVDVEFLRYWFRLPAVIARVDADCSGSTPLTRNRYKEIFFTALEIPLPTLAEQRRVVARIEELSAQIHEARTFRLQSADDADALLVAMAHRGDMDQGAKVKAGWKQKRLSDVIQLVNDSHKVEPDGSYPNIGMYSFGRGLFHKPPISGLTVAFN